MSTNEVEVKARKMGWLPKEQFRGNTDNWVDADRYVARGEEFIPFIKADRDRLEGQLATTNGEISSLKTQLTEAMEVIQAFKEFRTEINKDRLEEAKTNLVAGIKQAREDGDVDKEESLRLKLNEASAALRVEPEKPKPAAPAAPAAPDVTKTPEWAGFIQANPWWNDDPVMRAASLAISADMAAKGELDNMNQTQRFEKIALATKKRFGLDESPTRSSRVEGGRGGQGARDDGGGGEKSFGDLPPEVKAAADRMESRLVGKKPGQFKTQAEHRTHYAQEYFRRYPNG